MSLEDNIRTCKGEGCDADVLWLRIEKKDGSESGWHPFSVDSKEPRYIIKRGRNGALVAKEFPTITSHFADCPNAGDLRGDGDG